MLSEPENEDSNNNNSNSNNLTDLFKPDFLKSDFNLFSTTNDQNELDENQIQEPHKIPRSATITCNKTSKPNDNNSNIRTRDDPEMSSFVQNYHNIRFSSHGHMNNISKKDIRNRAKAITRQKRQEEKERKRKEREHLNSANELSKS